MIPRPTSATHAAGPHRPGTPDPLRGSGRFGRDDCDLAARQRPATTPDRRCSPNRSLLDLWGRLLPVWLAVAVVYVAAALDLDSRGGQLVTITPLERLGGVVLVLGLLSSLVVAWRED